MPQEDEFGIPIKKKQSTQNVDEFGIEIKKKSGSISGSIGGTVGSSKAQSSVSINPPNPKDNPFAIGQQFNQPPKLEAEKLDLSNTQKNAAIAEQIKTPLRRIPETPILDNTKIQKPISDIDANEAIARQQQHKKDLETAIDNTTLKVLKQKGIVAGKGSPYYEAERKKIEAKTKPTMIGGIVINGAEATYHKDKDGNIGLDRNLGFFEGIRKGFNAAVDGEDEANAFAEMDTKQKVEYANKQMEGKPTEYMEERGGVGELLGGATPYLVKAAAAGTLATASSLVGAAPVLTVLLTAPDMIKQGAKDEIMTRYHQLKQENPLSNDEDLMRIAEQGGISGGIVGAAEALAFTTTLKLPILKDSKDVLTTYLKGVASSAVHLGGIMAGTTAAKIAERKLEGYNVKTDEAIDEITTAFTENAKAGAILNGVISGAHTLPKVIKSAFKYALKDTPISEIKTALQANVEAGRIPPEVAEKTVADIEGYKVALAKTADGLKPETQASVAGLIQARDNVAAEMATKDPTQRAVYEQKIEAYNKQIEKITETNDPLKYEIDEVTGNPIDKIAPKGEPENISQPIELSTETKRADVPPPTEQQSGDVSKDSGLRSVDEVEVQRQMQPITDKMAEIEREFENKGYEIDWDYDNEIQVTDKKGNLLDAEDVPTELHKSAAEYEKATRQLGEFSQSDFVKSLDNSRKRAKGEEIPFEEVGKKQLPQQSGKDGVVDEGVGKDLKIKYGGKDKDLKGNPQMQWMKPKETSEQATNRLAEFVEASDYKGREQSTFIDREGESVEVKLRNDGGKWNWYEPKSKKPFASFDTAKDAIKFIQEQPFWDNGELNKNGRNDTYFSKVKSEQIKSELDNGNILEDINDGKITAQDAQKIIESVGLEVPKEILSLSTPKAEPLTSNVVGDVKVIKKNLSKRLKGDKLLDAEDLVDELNDNKAEIDNDGMVTVYHRTTPENKAEIERTGKMTGLEDGVFFSTKETGQNEGYGDAIVKLKVPIEKLELDDSFGNEAHLRIPTKKAGEIVNVKDYMPKPQPSNVVEGSGKGGEVVKEEKAFTTNALNRADAKKIFAQVREVDTPQDAAQVALAYLANGGKVSEAAINEVAGSVKRASLNTGARELKSSEAKARRDYSDKKEQTLDQLAHQLWEENGQRIPETEIKDELMKVIGNHNTRLDAGKAYLEKYSAEYNEKKLQEKFYQEHLEEMAAEENAINEMLSKENTLAEEAMADDNYVIKLIEKYETENKGQDKQPATKTESGTDKGISSKESDGKTSKTEPIKNEEAQAPEVPNPKTGDSTPKPETGEAAYATEKGKFEEKARKLAEKIMATDIVPDWLKIDNPNVKKSGADAETIKKALADATIKMGKLLDKGVEFGEAVKEAVKELVNMLGEGARDKIEEGFAKDYKEQTGDNFEQRRFTKQMLRSDELSGESKAEISKTLNYVRQKNSMSVKEANEALEKVGIDEAQSLVMNDGELKGAVRVTLGQVIIKKYNELSKKATDQATKDYYLDKSIQTASFVTEKLGTEAGQSIQAFSMWAQLSPEGQLRAANQDMAAQGKEKLRRREKDIKVISDKFQKANEEAVDELTNSPKVKETVKKTRTAQDKVDAAKKKIDDIIKKHKADKGKNLYAGIGLTKDGIEFVGDLVSAYVQLGGAKLEVVIDKVLAHLKEVSGKVPNDTVRENVANIVKERFEKDENKRISEGLSELETNINKIIKEHYTVSGESKKSLIDKFIEKAGLDKTEAERLAKEVETEFDKIATRKKRNILYNEKARFDKINKTLKGSKTPEQKTLATEIIKYSNLGAFEGKEFADMIASKFGLGEISTEQAAKLIELAKRVEKAPEGSPKNNATEDLLAYRAKIKGNDLGETVQSVWYANVLSGYKTQEKNIVSTFFQSMGELGSQMAKDPKSIPYLMAGYLKGVGTRGLVEAGNTMKTGYSPIHIKKIEVPNALERKKFVGGAINPANWLKYVMRTMVASDVLSFQGLKEARAYQLARREVQNQGFNTWTKKGWDEVNKVLMHTKERWEAAELQVKEEGITGKLEKRRRIYELMEDSRPIKMTEDTYGFAAKGTFNHESEGTLGAITNAVAQSLDVVNIGGVKPARFIVPFTRIITNVVNNSLDFTPVGLVRAARGVRGFRSFESNRFTKGAFKELSRDERTTLLAKAGLGITLAATFQAMHQAGTIQITGGGTGNNQKDEQLRQEGWQEYSIKIGDRYYSYKYTPLVFMMGYLGNMNDAKKYGGADEETVLKQMEVASSRIAGQVVDMTWINSAATFLGALAETNPTQQASGVNRALAGISRGFVPFGGMVTQVNDVFAMNKKQTTNAWQGLIASIPIARNSLNDRINALGEPVKVDSDVLMSSETKDTVWKYLFEKQGWVAPVNKNTIIVYDQKTKQDRPITNDEYYEFSKIRGSKIRHDIETIIALPTVPVIRDGKEVQVKPIDLTKTEFNKILTKIEGKATPETKEKMFGEKSYTEKQEDKKEDKVSDKWNEKINKLIKN